MGLPAQPDVRHLARDRSGMALPVALLGVVAIGLLSAGAWVVVDLDARSMANRESSARALQLAEAGATHAMAVLEEYLSDESLTGLLVGSDGLSGTDDDGLLTGFDIPYDVEIPAAGFAWGDGTYTVSFLDDPNESDGDERVDQNGRILVRCSAETSDGARATVDFMLASTVLAPAIVVNGDLDIGGSVELLGSCGGLYANGIVDVTGTLVVGQGVMSSDSVRVSGAIEDLAGNDVQPLSNQASVEVPTYDLWDTCDGADYVLGTDGWITTVATGMSTKATTGQGAFGWVQKTTGGNTFWELVAHQAVEGTFCVQGNAKLDGDLGSAADPFAMTVFATGGISASGNLVIEPDHAGDYLLMAKGDLKIAGNIQGASPDLVSGILYAGSQCQLSGNPSLSAQLLCANAPDPAGAINYATENDLGGNVQFTYPCPPTAAVSRWVAAWFQRFGT